jgi:hypothetical protein
MVDLLLAINITERPAEPYFIVTATLIDVIAAAVAAAAVTGPIYSLFIEQRRRASRRIVTESAPNRWRRLREAAPQVAM